MTTLTFYTGEPVVLPAWVALVRPCDFILLQTAIRQDTDPPLPGELDGATPRLPLTQFTAILIPPHVILDVKVIVKTTTTSLCLIS